MEFRWNIYRNKTIFINEYVKEILKIVLYYNGNILRYIFGPFNLDVLDIKLAENPAVRYATKLDNWFIAFWNYVF